ncbi:thiamine pyrophosphate-binding protein [Nonomuraea sp. NPDC050790]|uniref:thiamine pyrophosphate-binding protein n=1 Tax=Nonomuraea sp. NPDC050790 TaxID=3364371 RepID=UPI0037B3335B
MPSAEPGTPLWRHVAAVLAGAGCHLVTGVPSDEPALLDAALTVPGLKGVPVRDQRAGACLAAGHALVSGSPAVLATNSGPSLPNAMAGLLEAASLHAPVVVVTTRIPRSGLGRGGFQQVDQRALCAAVAKWHVLAEQVDQLDWALRQAVHRAVNGAPGVVVVEIAEEVLQGEPPPETAPLAETAAQGPVRRLRSAPAADDLGRAAEVMAEATAPVIIAGGGAKASGAGAPLRALAETWGAAVFATAAGRAVLDEDHPRYCGLAGLYAGAPAAALLDDADVILALGTRLEETVRTGWTLSRQRLIHVDIDPDAFGLAVRPEIALAGDAALTARLLAAALRPNPSPAWSERIAAVRAQPVPEGSLAASTLRAVAARFGRDLVLVQENGLHDMWSYHFPLLSLSERAKVVAPGEQTMMGFGVAASLGAALAQPSLPTVVICGDGAMTMSMNALPVATELGRGIVFVVFDNGGFGWPRHVRALAGSDTRLTRFPGGEPPYEAVVRALGGWTARCHTAGDLGPALEEAAKHAANGTLALVAVPVSDTDIPPGVLRVYGGAPEPHDKADDHDT